MKKPTIEYRWEAYYPETGKVFKRGPIRNDIGKVAKYAVELIDEIFELEDEGWVDKKKTSHLAPYWEDSKIRVLTRTISPWVEMEDW